MTPEQQAAMRQALEACQLIVNAFDALKPASAARTEPLQINAAREAITALRQALEQQPADDKPMAWYDPDMDSAYSAGDLDGEKVDGLIPLYTRPQPAAQWVGLTAEEKFEVSDISDSFEDVVDAVEAKLREKNGGKA